MVGPVGQLMRTDPSPTTVTVYCVCGWTAVTYSRTAARGLKDRHREMVHPRQATYVASKRRARADVSAGAARRGR